MRNATVAVTVATLWTSPDAPREIDTLLLGERVDAVSWAASLDAPGRMYDGIVSQLRQGEPVTIDEVRDGWARVVATAQPSRLDSRGYPGWLPVHQLADAQPLGFARELLGTRYLWGGLTEHGIDCSGLIHLAYRRAGITLPRDAVDQAAATLPVQAGQEQAGDLYFFARMGRPIHHVGFVTAEPGVMLDACYYAGRVQEAQLSQDRLDTLVAIHRVG